MISALTESSRSALVRTTFDLSPAEHTVITSAVTDTLGPEIQVQFATDPDLISGVELTTNGHKVSWSIADYLTSLERKVDDLLKEQPKAEAKVEPKPELKPEPKVNEHGA